MRACAVRSLDDLNLLCETDVNLVTVKRLEDESILRWCESVKNGPALEVDLVLSAETFDCAAVFEPFEAFASGIDSASAQKELLVLLRSFSKTAQIKRNRYV